MATPPLTTRSASATNASGVPSGASAGMSCAIGRRNGVPSGTVTDFAAGGGCGCEGVSGFGVCCVGGEIAGGEIAGGCTGGGTGAGGPEGVAAGGVAAGGVAAGGFGTSGGGGLRLDQQHHPPAPNARSPHNGTSAAPRGVLF